MVFRSFSVSQGGHRPPFLGVIFCGEGRTFFPPRDQAYAVMSCVNFVRGEEPRSTDAKFSARSRARRPYGRRPALAQAVARRRRIGAFLYLKEQDLGFGLRRSVREPARERWVRLSAAICEIDYRLTGGCADLIVGMRRTRCGVAGRRPRRGCDRMSARSETHARFRLSFSYRLPMRSAAALLEAWRGLAATPPASPILNSILPAMARAPQADVAQHHAGRGASRRGQSQW